MKFDGVIFDLDGTLLDTLTDIANAANSVLEQQNYPIHPVDAYRKYVGNGVITLFERALPAHVVSPSLLNRCREGFHVEYAQQWNEHAKPYIGIPEMLDTLTDQKLRMGVLSNKPHAFTKLCVEELLDKWEFNPVLGERTGVPIKPDPHGAAEIAEIWNLPSENCLYVGDTSVDMATARNADMYAVGVTWGFRDRAELVAAGAQEVIDHPQELLSLISGS